MLGRVVEVINGHDGKTRGLRIMMGKSKTVISRLVNKVYPLELVEENEGICKEMEQRNRPRRSENLEKKNKHNNSRLIVAYRVL